MVTSNFDFRTLRPDHTAQFGLNPKAECDIDSHVVSDQYCIHSQNKSSYHVGTPPHHNHFQLDFLLILSLSTFAKPSEHGYKVATMPL
jgi:hypothetical protein